MKVFIYKCRPTSGYYGIGNLTICVTSLERVHMSQKNVVDLNRAGHDKSVKKYLAFEHKYLRSYDQFANLFQLPS